MIYIKFKSKVYNKTKSNHNKSFLDKLKDIIFYPIMANPDYENVITDVYEWCIEYNGIEDFIEREIGMNIQKQVIVKMPYKKNYGFWLDTDLKLNDFMTKMEATIIDYGDFQNK